MYAFRDARSFALLYICSDDISIVVFSFKNQQQYGKSGEVDEIAIALFMYMLAIVESPPHCHQPFLDYFFLSRFPFLHTLFCHIITVFFTVVLTFTITVLLVFVYALLMARCTSGLYKLLSHAINT